MNGFPTELDTPALIAARKIMSLTRSGEHDDHLKAKIQVAIIEAMQEYFSALVESKSSDSQEPIEPKVYLTESRQQQLIDAAPSFPANAVRLAAREAVANVLEQVYAIIEDYCSDSPDLAGHGHSQGLKDFIKTQTTGDNNEN